MRSVLISTIILNTITVIVMDDTIQEEVDKAFNDCLLEFQITVEEFESTETNLTCFHACIAVKSDIMKDKKIDGEKLSNYFRSTQEPEMADRMIEAIAFCIGNMPEIEDECESYLSLEECVDQKLTSDEEESNV